MTAAAQWQARSGDLLAGLSVAGLLVPEAVAYAGIAGLAPGRALIAGVVGGLIYALVGPAGLRWYRPHPRRHRSWQQRWAVWQRRRNWSAGWTAIPWRRQ